MSALALPTKQCETPAFTFLCSTPVINAVAACYANLSTVPEVPSLLEVPPEPECLYKASPMMEYRDSLSTLLRLMDVDEVGACLQQFLLAGQAFLSLLPTRNTIAHV